ncbi:MAG: hypothetical protein KatS3mg131_0849 [Candidatus Tectimicrobiota bacterium]|nr:MAG: hypothetical protein KatS3mg131_0849 [Candidatus Tectomicrobia bacterium]
MRRATFLFLLLLLGRSVLAGQPPTTPPPEGTALYAFGVELFRLGEYYRAITELKRFSLLFPHHPRQPLAQLLIGLALQEDGAYEAAFAHFQRLQQEPGEVAQVAAFKLGELRFWQGQYPQAIALLSDFRQRFPTGPLVPRSTYLLGLSHALHGDFVAAGQAFALLPAGHPLQARAQALQHELQEGLPVAKKSPRTAGLLAGVLPGAGHLYLGQPLRGLTALLLNGLFLTGAVFAAREGLEAVAAILLYFETGWYLGNINSAVQGARDENRRRLTAVQERLRATYAPPPLGFDELQALGLQLRF